MKKAEDIISDIRKSLLEIAPYKIILFGSYANNSNTESSDIDLLVILDKDTVSGNYQERMANKLLVRQCLYELSKQIPIDIIVYTKKEYEIIEKNKNSFFKEVDQTGKVVYEKAG